MLHLCLNVGLGQMRVYFSTRPSSSHHLLLLPNIARLVFPFHSHQSPPPLQQTREEDQKKPSSHRLNLSSSLPLLHLPLSQTTPKNMSQLIRNVIASNPLHRIKPTQTLPSIFHQTPLNHFSTEPENPNPQQQQDPQNPQQQDSQQPPPPPHSFVNSVFHRESKGPVYGKLSGTGKHTLKTDVINMLEGCGLTLNDIKLDYTRHFNPIAMVLQFPSGSAFTTAAKVIRGKGRILTLEKLDPVYWNEAADFDGKTVLLQGMPRYSTPEDIERFLCGCNFNASNMELFLRGGNPDPIKMALVHFPSQAEAMRAVLSKNKNFVLNNRVMMRVLQ